MYQSRIIVVVLAAFCLAQGFEARVVEPKLSVNDVIEKIREVVEKVKDIILELIVDLEDIIIASCVDLDVIMECFLDERFIERDLIWETIDKFDKCTQNVNVNDLKKELKVLQEEVRDLVVNAKEIVNKCVQEHPGDKDAVASCLKRELVALKKNVAAVVNQLKKTHVVAKETLQNVPHDVKQCVATVVDEAVEKQNDIINEFKECVASHSEI